jgi:hypothetical protein
VKCRNAIWQALAVWTVALVIAGLAALLAFIATAHAQSRLDNLISGSASATGTSQTTIIAAPSGTRVNYITAVQCGRTDTGTSAIFVTFNDDASTVMVLPNSGGGGGSNMTFPNPLMVAGAFKFTAMRKASRATNDQRARMTGKPNTTFARSEAVAGG